MKQIFFKVLAALFLIGSIHCVSHQTVPQTQINNPNLAPQDTTLDDSSTGEVPGTIQDISWMGDQIKSILVMDYPSDFLVTNSDSGFIIAHIVSATKPYQTLQELRPPHGITWSFGLFTPLGDKVITISGSLIFLWDSQTGKLLSVLRGHNAAIIAAAFSGNGEQLITGEADGKALVWRVDTGKLLYELDTNNELEQVALSQDGSLAATGSVGGDVSIWEKHKKKSLSVRPSLLSKDQALQARNKPFGKNNKEYQWHIASLSFLPNKKEIVIGARQYYQKDDLSSTNELLGIWTIETTAKKEPILFSGSEFTAAVSSDGSKMITADHDNVIHLRDTRTTKELFTFRPYDFISEVGFSPNGNQVFSKTLRWKRMLTLCGTYIFWNLKKTNQSEQKLVGGICG